MGKSAEQKYLDQQAAARGAYRNNVSGLLSGMDSRIKALDDEGNSTTPLSQDANFQGQRAQLVSGGQQLASGIQNRQRAAGVSGGFANTGSIQDAYDRMGSQLAQLGGQQQQFRAERRDAADQMRNSQMQGRMSLEQGDLEGSLEGLRNALEIQQRNKENKRQFWGGIASGVLSAAGSAAAGGKK
jgi:hypothetical protein